MTGRARCDEILRLIDQVLDADPPDSPGEQDGATRVSRAARLAGDAGGHSTPVGPE